MVILKVEWLVNFVIVLLFICGYIIVEKIRFSVVGYLDSFSVEVFFWMFECDKNELCDFGILFEVGRVLVLEFIEGYCINCDVYVLLFVELILDEVVVVVVVIQLWELLELIIVIQGVLLKLWVVGVDVDFLDIGVLVVIVLVVVVLGLCGFEDVFGILLLVIDFGQVVQFFY